MVAFAIHSFDWKADAALPSAASFPGPTVNAHGPAPRSEWIVSVCEPKTCTVQLVLALICSICKTELLSSAAVLLLVLAEEQQVTPMSQVFVN